MGSHSHPKGHTAASHSDQGATGAELEELTDGSETTLHSHAADGTTIFTGSYTGNDAVNRQITTGFQCSFALVMGVRYGTSYDFGMMIPGASADSRNITSTDKFALHASDGFEVSKAAGVYFNISPNTYYYWAISE